MTWREKFLIYFGSSYFFGITPGEWFGLLRENRFAIAPACLLRAGSITFLSAANGVLRLLENARYRKAWERIGFCRRCLCWATTVAAPRTCTICLPSTI